MKRIEDLIVSKACMKQDVYATTKSVFEELRDVLSEIERDLLNFIQEKDKRVKIDLKMPGEFEADLYFGGDLLVFAMHSNVFTFPGEHFVHKNPYVKKDARNAYVGEINIYNFLADSYRYHRMNDSGYLLARIFVNRERHFFVEGKRQLGYKFNDFANARLDRAAIKQIVEESMHYAIEFDLFVQPYGQVKEVSVADMSQLSQNQKLKTGKRLGFQFSAEENKLSY